MVSADLGGSGVIFIFFSLGFALSALGCLTLLRLWPLQDSGWDKGDVFRKKQRKPVLRLGGVGIMFGLVAVTLVAVIAEKEGATRGGDPRLVLLVCFTFFGIGLLDDLAPVPAVFKLVAQVAAASLAYALGFRIELVSEPFSGASLALDGLAYPATLFWLVALPNLINLVDGIDGVAGGVGLSLIGTLAVVSWASGDLLLTILCLGMVGATAGFLCFNLPKARLYLGDGGAYLLGAFIATTSISASQKGVVAGTLLVVVLALALPIADTVFAMLRRAFYGFPIWRADSEHIHHRLVTLGLRKGIIISGMVGAVAIFAILGLGLVLGHERLWPVAIMAIIVGGLFLVRILGYWGSLGAFRQHVRRMLITRERVRYAYVLSMVLEHEIDRTPSPQDFWRDFRRSMAKVGLFPCSPDGSIDEIPHGAEMDLLTVRLANGDEWILQHRESCEEMHWGKIAACFQGPLCRAIGKWGRIPSNLGVRPGDEPGESHYVGAELVFERE